LKAKPSLQVLIVSSYEPKGKVESEAYWASRIDFKAILENDIEPGRVLMSYSSIKDEQGNTAYKRIHSKVMSVDDQYLVIGSSNISNRSMSLDTEVDLVFYGDNKKNKNDIIRVRNDLLAEHTGRNIDQVESLMKEPDPLNALINNQPKYHYVLSEVDDSRFTTQSWQSLFGTISDPEEPLIPAMQSLDGKLIPVTNPRRRTIMTVLSIALVAILATIIIMIGQTIPWMNADNLSTFLEESRGTMWALPTILLVYAVGGLLFMPVTLMSLAVAAIFGPIYGPLYGILGALLSSAILFGIGKLLGNAGLRKIGGPKVAAVDEKFKNSGVVGVAAIRLLPIAPFSLVNLVAGISSINIFTFLAGTFLGMFPPMIAKGLVGDSLAQIFTNPSPQTIAYLIGGIVLWIVMIIATQKFAKYYQQRKAAKCTA
jgi:phospholipase D1/2